MTRIVNWLLLMLWLIAIGILVFGCVSVAVPTDLRLPAFPNLTFISRYETVCLLEPDADKLLRYLEEVEAFRESWQRLQP